MPPHTLSPATLFSLTLAQLNQGTCVNKGKLLNPCPPNPASFLSRVMFSLEQTLRLVLENAWLIWEVTPGSANREAGKQDREGKDV